MIRNISFSVNTAIERLSKPSSIYAWFRVPVYPANSQPPLESYSLNFVFRVLKNSAENMASYLLQEKENLRALAK